MVPYKGGDHEASVEQCLRDLKTWGLRGDIIFRSDQEDALKALVAEIIVGRSTEAT